MNFGRSVISSFSKKKLKNLYIKINDYIHESPEDFQYMQWYLALQDLIETKLHKKQPPNKKKTLPKNKTQIHFVNKGVKIINLPKILNSTKHFRDCLISK